MFNLLELHKERINLSITLPEIMVLYQCDAKENAPDNVQGLLKCLL